MMMDDRLDDAIRDAAREYHAPPETPREAIWARLQAARADRRAPIPMAARPGRRRLLLWAAPLGLAAALLLGVAIGRLTERPDAPAAGRVPAVAGPTVAVRVAAADHLSRIDALLVDYASGRDELEVSAAARDLLVRTRMWLDADRIADPRLRSLLEDLELMLVQIARLGAPTAADERGIIERGLSERAILPRLRNAIPAGPSA